jgi:hypothetical protein
MTVEKREGTKDAWNGTNTFPVAFTIRTRGVAKVTCALFFMMIPSWEQTRRMDMTASAM